MDLQGAHKPGSLSRRYAALPTAKKDTYYALRRHLNFTRTDVDEMPWWELRMWIEKLNIEFPDNPADNAPPPEPEEISDDASEFGLSSGSLA